MGNNSETGHPANVASLEKLTSDAESFGATFNPSREELKISALNALVSSGNAALKAVNLTKPLYDNSSDNREIAFKPLSKLVTRVVNALKSFAVPKQTIEATMTIVRKIQGRRSSPKMTEEEKKEAEANGKVITEISTSQMGFDDRLGNFEKLIDQLATISQYTPNEADLSIAGLTSYCNTLKEKNAAVKKADGPYRNALIARDELFYKEETGLVDIGLAVKNYIKSVYGPGSPQYKMVSKIKFSRPR